MSITFPGWVFIFWKSKLKIKWRRNKILVFCAFPLLLATCRLICHMVHLLSNTCQFSPLGKARRVVRSVGSERACLDSEPGFATHSLGNLGQVTKSRFPHLQSGGSSLLTGPLGLSEICVKDSIECWMCRNKRSFYDLFLSTNGKISKAKRKIQKHAPLFT